jgi:trehalose 6-phosphate phosphatase
MKELLLAADFDGTLSAISPDPGVVTIDPAMAAFLRRAAAMDGVAIAIISGRDVEDLSLRVKEVPAYLAGSHGLEIRSPHGQLLREAAPLDASLDPRIERDARALGVRIERKKHAIALHWREAPQVDESHPIVAAFREWAAAHDLDVIGGRRVVEARCHGGGKEDALRHLATITGAQRVIYAGDDLTDFHALRYAAARGRAYFVASDEREPPPVATTVQSRDELLRMLIAEIGGRDSRHVPATRRI